MTAAGTADARLLTAWAAGCAERALAMFATTFTDDLAGRTIAAARAWSTGAGPADACREAAFEAQATAREAHDAGYRALAVALRSAASAAASVDDPGLAVAAALLASESLTVNSAPCEQDANAATERRQQWLSLPAHLRPGVFGEGEPPAPEPAACAVGPTDAGPAEHPRSDASNPRANSQDGHRIRSHTGSTARTSRKLEEDA